MEWYELILIIIGASSLTNRLFMLVDFINRPVRKRKKNMNKLL